MSKQRRDKAACNAQMIACVLWYIISRRKKKTKLNEILQVKSQIYSTVYLVSIQTYGHNTQKNEKPMQTPQTPPALLALFNGTAASAYSKALEAFDIVLVK